MGCRSAHALLKEEDAVDRLTITLNDETKRDELLDVVASLPYVKTVQIEQAVDDITVELSPKNGDSYKATLAANRQAPTVDPLDQEVVLFEEQHEQLAQQFLGQYIAMVQGRVIAHDANLDTLINNVHKTHPDTPVLFRLVQETLPPILHFRSPRLEKR